MSVPPPGAKPTMMRIGPAGSVCARSMGAASAAAVAATKVLRCMVVSWVYYCGKRSGCLLEQCRCRVGSEEIHGAGDARTRELHARELQAHLAAGERGHEREVVAIAQVPDAEHAALHLAQARAERE